jgi:hypothetical protein
MGMSETQCCCCQAGLSCCRLCCPAGVGMPECDRGGCAAVGCQAAITDLEQIMTFAPSDASRSAMPSPMPAVAAVTTATLPSRRLQVLEED